MYSDWFANWTQRYRAAAYTTAASGRGSWRNIRPPAVRLLEGRYSGQSSEPSCGRTAPSVIVGGDAALPPVNQTSHCNQTAHIHKLFQLPPRTTNPEMLTADICQLMASNNM